MIIEQNTNYAYKLKYMENPTFDKVRDLAIRFMRELPKQLQDELYEALNRGVDILDSEPQMVTYLYAFGPMHQAKLNYAFKHLPEEFLAQPEINIIDYGCGQALGTMCYADFSRENGYSQKVKTITLIEPSDICLKRAGLHASVFFPEAEIKTVHKELDKLTDDDVVCNNETPTLHILSNILDILDFELEEFARMIKAQIKGYNKFVCVGPFFNTTKDERIDDFVSLLDGVVDYWETFDKYELDPEKAWTAQILCFSKNSIGTVYEYDGVCVYDCDHDEYGCSIYTAATEKEVKNGFVDRFGVVYSKDGNKLLVCNSFELEVYSIKIGTMFICDNAFTSYNDELNGSIERSLKQITIPNSVTVIGESAFYGCKSLQNVVIPNSVTCIKALAFCKCTSIQEITIPNSITCIDYGVFDFCSSLRQITLPNSIKMIMFGAAFRGCASLEKIRIPIGSTQRFKKMLWSENYIWDKLVEE